MTFANRVQLHTITEATFKTFLGQLGVLIKHTQETAASTHAKIHTYNWFNSMRKMLTPQLPSIRMCVLTLLMRVAYYTVPYV